MSKAAKRERQRQNREAARAARQAAQRRARTLRTGRNFAIVAVAVAVAAVTLNLVTGGKAKKAGAPACTDRRPAAPKPQTLAAPPPMTIDPTKAYTATIDTSCGTITIALDPKTAPVATNNFAFLAQKAFYDGLTFHRAAKDFVIQGGDPRGDGSGGPGYTVPGEVPRDHYPEGSLAAAKTGAEPPGTFGSQFFVVTGSQGATLPNDYARFGDVTKGLDVAKKIASFAPASGDGPPTRTIYIFKVSITESGVNTSAPPGSTAPSKP